ncbi:glycosyltransferase family 4 protein [Vibrio breoganii]|uniref:glycosyltransferase family 4 protein n=1 Tax=Vibrio breoganii TaxID=553239 RepID=UPI0021C4925B|nr:glycosyltransferase family 4 protein [Vibrio breoganii]MDN3715926.1 glycosyltransferase family 4 protein [Vibrio breoganii]
MNIWYIHPYSGSPQEGMSFRPYYLAKNLSEQHKCNVTIISSGFHHLCRFGENKPKNEVIEVEGVPYFLVPTKKYESNGLNRVLNMLSFGMNMMNKHFRRFSRLNKPDTIIASTAHPFYLPIALYYARKYNAKLILEVRDLWPLSLTELTQINKFHPLALLIQIFQNFGYRNCDHCVSLLANSETYIRQRGLKKQGFSYIPNGIEVENDGELDQCQAYDRISKDISNFDYCIGYTGAVGTPNFLDPLIDAATDLGRLKVAIVIVGTGVEKERLLLTCQEQSLKNVFFYEPVPKSSISNILRLFDLAFINAKPSILYGYGISPNKIFDYMMANKVVLSGINAPNNPLQVAESEIFFDTLKKDDLVNKVLKFIKKPYKVNSKRVVLDRFNYQHLASLYSNIIELKERKNEK